jgi:hypothetical protein
VTDTVIINLESEKLLLALDSEASDSKARNPAVHHIHQQAWKSSQHQRIKKWRILQSLAQDM